MVQKDVQFLMKNNKVLQPFIPTDGLELYYDVKGKKNTDNYKDTLLDMSGNGRHGTLSNFAYEGVSGFTGTTEGGLLLDDVDDKIVRPAISGIEYTSASRNVFSTVTAEWELGTFDDSNLNAVSTTVLRQINAVSLTPNIDYAISVLSGYLVSVNVNGANTVYAQSATFNSQSGTVRFMVKKVDESTLTTAMATTALIQLEKGSTATAYTPYIPLPIMTYQMNGNILSFDKDGTVKRTTKDANGNEVVVSRKGINLVRNGNFYNRSNGWRGAGASFTSFSENSAELTVIGGGTQWVQPSSDTQLFAVNGHKVYASLYTTTTNTESSTNLMIDAGVTQTLTSLSRVNSLPGWNKLEGIATLSGQIGAREIKIYNGHTFSTAEISVGQKFLIKNVQLIDLTDAYGAGNEPDLAYIQAHPEEFAWTPNPNDLIETVEIKNNLVGDLENLQGNDFEQHEDGVITYTNEAEEGSVVRVDIDGISDQPLRFRTATGEQVVITEHDQIDTDAIKKIEFQGNSVQLADKYREVSGTSVMIAPELHDKNVADKLVIGGNTYQYTESSNVVTDGLQMWLSGRNFSNSPATTTWKDLTGVNNGTASGFAYTTASGSDGNGGIVFDGVNDRIPIYGTEGLMTTGTEKKPITLEVWGKMNGQPREENILLGKAGNNTGLIAGNNRVGIGWWAGTTAPNYTDTYVRRYSNVTANTNFHAVATIMNGTIKFYLNGVLQFTDMTLVGKTYSNRGAALTVGSTNGDWFFNGTVYCSRLYSKVLTDVEVLQNYNAGLAIPIPNIVMPQEVKHVNSGSKVLAHKKNLLDTLDSTKWTNSAYSTTTNLFGYSANRLTYSPKIYITKLANYTLSFNTSTNGIVLYQFDKDDKKIYDSGYIFSTTTVTALPNASYIKISMGLNTGDGIITPSQVVGTLFQLEQGATATSYEPYIQTETTIPVTLKSIG